MERDGRGLLLPLRVLCPRVRSASPRVITLLFYRIVMFAPVMAAGRPPPAPSACGNHPRVGGVKRGGNKGLILSYRAHNGVTYAENEK